MFSNPLLTYGQVNWTSTKGYTIEVPKGFVKKEAVGANVDFKAVEGNNSVVIVVKNLPSEYYSATIWDLTGNLETFASEWEQGANEFMDNPQVIKFGKTSIDQIDAFWMDYKTDRPPLYSKAYQTKRGNKLYVLTFTCSESEINHYNTLWFRFVDQFSFR